MRAIWSGAIGFGLVNIPVRIFSATQDSALSLDMLDKHDHSNIRYARINQETGKEVAWKDIVKGFKYNDKYVVLTDEDFEKANPKKSKMIEISEFAPLADIETYFYETPYYLEPAKGGEKAYSLLREALKKAEKVAVGLFIMRTKENLCLIKPHEDILILNRIRFSEEIRDYSSLNIPGKIEIKPAELKMAISLISQLTPKKFDLSKYKDQYDEELMKIVKLKSKGKEITAPKFKMVKNNSKDLMEQLKASLNDKIKRKAS